MAFAGFLFTEKLVRLPQPVASDNIFDAIQKDCLFDIICPFGQCIKKLSYWGKPVTARTMIVDFMAAMSKNVDLGMRGSGTGAIGHRTSSACADRGGAGDSGAGQSGPRLLFATSADQADDYSGNVQTRFLPWEVFQLDSN